MSQRSCLSTRSGAPCATFPAQTSTHRPQWSSGSRALQGGSFCVNKQIIVFTGCPALLCYSSWSGLENAGLLLQVLLRDGISSALPADILFKGRLWNMALPQGMWAGFSPVFGLNTQYLGILPHRTEFLWGLFHESGHCPVVSSPLQAPSEVSALYGGLHQGLTKRMLIVGCTVGILNHIPSNQMEQADMHGSTSAGQAGWEQHQNPPGDDGIISHRNLTVGSRMEQMEPGNGEAAERGWTWSWRSFSS